MPRIISRSYVRYLNAMNWSVREHLRGHPALLSAAVSDLADLLLPDVENNGVFKSLT